MNKRVVFFGNSKYSVIDAEALYKRFGLSAVVTIPDRIIPRKAPHISPVKVFAQAHDIPVIEAAKLTAEVIERINSFEADFLVVADYGLILPKKLLALPKYASLNVHHSLLPKYRGPAPAPAAILNGETDSGVSIIVMNEKVDAGDILKQIPYPMKSDETTDSLLTTLNTLGAKAVVEVIENYIDGQVHPTAQDESKATFTSFMSSKDGQLNLSESPELNWRKIRAYGEWPGTFFFVMHNGKNIRVKITKARYENGVLTIESVIPENKREMSYTDFLRGLR